MIFMVKGTSYSNFLTTIARSGQCVSQKWQAVHFSGKATTGWLSPGPISSTLGGQNSTQMRHALHQVA
jgi:hypothetical protein